MELSYFLAQLFGLTYIISAVAIYIRPSIATSMVRDFKSNQFVVVIVGFMALVIGLAIVLSHNIWVANWTVIITIFGWAALLKGIAYLLSPDTILLSGEKILQNNKRRTIVLLVMFIFGFYLAYKGFGY